MAFLRSFEFDPFHIDLSKRVLLKEGHPVPLLPKTFDLLEVLVQHSGQLMCKNDLMQMVWPDTFVEEGNLTHNISLLRKALGERPGDHRYVVTVPGRGYRFVAEVRPVQQNQNGDSCSLGGRTEVHVIEQLSRSQIIVEEHCQHGDVQEWSRTGNGPSARHREPVLEAATAVEQPFPISAPLPVKLRMRPAVIVALASLCIASAAYFAFWKQKSVSTGPLDPSRTLAILPLRNLKPDSETDFLGFSLADSIATQLSRVAGVVVRPSSYMDKFRDRIVDPRDAARDLSVDTVMTGSYLKDGEDLRVTVQLIDVRGGRTLWQNTIDAKYENLFSIQDRIAGSVAANLSLVGRSNATPQKTATQSAEAYEAYLKGRYFWNRRTVPGFQKSIEYFQRAVSRDPDYARAYAGLADSYLLSGEFDKARSAALQALRLDEALAEAHTSVANLSLFHDWNWPEARRQFERAILLDPNYATAHHWYAYYCAAMGDLTGAISEISRARQLDPLSLIINTDLGQLMFFERRYGDATAQLKRTLEMDPFFVMAHWRLGEVYEQMGRYQEADAEFRYGQPPADVIYLSVLSGRHRGAIKNLGDLSARYPYYAALKYAALDDRDQAFQCLYEGNRIHDAPMVLLKAEPKMDSLRSDPRYRDLLIKMKLPH